MLEQMQSTEAPLYIRLCSGLSGMETEPLVAPCGVQHSAAMADPLSPVGCEVGHGSDLFQHVSWMLDLIMIWRIQSPLSCSSSHSWAVFEVWQAAQNSAWGLLLSRGAVAMKRWSDTLFVWVGCDKWHPPKIDKPRLPKRRTMYCNEIIHFWLDRGSGSVLQMCLSLSEWVSKWPPFRIGQTVFSVSALVVSFSK